MLIIIWLIVGARKLISFPSSAREDLGGIDKLGHFCADQWYDSNGAYETEAGCRLFTTVFDENLTMNQSEFLQRVPLSLFKRSSRGEREWHWLPGSSTIRNLGKVCRVARHE
mmetsp:Transcript_13226/g.20771  ORF Transcript_13226/g.20771 Transcript_13226/m.20771 type:complete len:112 (-) Transcript_13226:36-371(-)